MLALIAITRFVTPGMRAQAPADPCGAGGNAIACENSLAGNPQSEWDVAGSGDASIQGFATDISVNRGQTVHFKINTDATAYRIDIYRLGYYGGLGARKVATMSPAVPLPQGQPACTVDSASGLVDCGLWAESASWAVPANAVSGIYIARLTRTDSVSGASHIPFIVRDDTGGSDLLFQTSDTTWQAYNQFGGASLYTGGPGANPARAYKVSYNRPITTRGYAPEDYLFNAEYPMVRWLEANGYNVSYTSGVDGERNGAAIRNHKVFLSVGHDEYWSGTQRQQVEAARDAGVHLAFFSGNSVFWKARWEPSIDGSSTPNRTLVSYKETHNNAKIDPDPAWTGTWRDPRFSPPADGGRPENGLTGTLFVANEPATGAISVSDTDGQLRLWRNTSVATLAPGATATLTSGSLGYEWDTDVDNGARPAGLFHLSSTTMSLPQMLLDFGSNYGAGTATHNLTMYRAPSGALVFSAGTVQWSWGLDATHDRAGSATDVRMQQATVNLLADMSAQPFALRSGLVPASATNDTTAPGSTITWPTPSTVVTKDHPIVITGTATDAGGAVAGVEVSTDGGLTWHPAAGRGSWSYGWTPGTSGSATILSRAVDDSGNLQVPPSSVGVTVASGCPCTLWTNDTVPALTDAGDVNAVELGVKFRADVDGFISGIRFYKSAANTGTHVGNLWSASGTLLGTVTFSNETASGWQEATFSSPVGVTANTVYVASYHTNTAHYSYSGSYFGADYANAPLRAVSSGANGGNGVYKYGAASGFPDQTYNSANYWVDIVFTAPSADTTPPTVSSVTPASGAVNVAAGSAVTVTFSEAMNASTITTSTVQLRDAGNNLVAANVSYDGANHAAVLQPSGPLAGSSTYTLTVVAGVSGVADLAGNRLASTFISSFTTTDTTPPVVNSVTPGVSAANVAVNSTVTVTFNEAMAPASINTSSFQLLDPNNQGVAATVTYDAGTRTATLTPSSALATSATYTARLNAGSTGVTDLAGNPLVSAFVWTFSTVPGADVTPPAVTTVTPSANAIGVAVASTISATFSEAIAPATIGAATFTVRDSSNNAVAGTVAYNGTAHSATFTPSASLAFATTYAATVTGGPGGVQDLAGNSMTANFSWSFTTVSAPSGCPCTIWDATAVPQNADANDNNPVELGVKFRATTNGYIHGIRFYKGPTNTGAHVGSLWDANGTLLAQATFAGETASGWQQVIFNTSVPITAGLTYVASYHTNTGQYSYNGAYFATAGVDRGPLHAMQNGESGTNGVYRYGGSSIFPDQSFNSTNYWVDVLFDTTAADITPPTVLGSTPANGSTNVATTTAVTATFSEAIDPATISTTTMELRDASNLLVSAAVTYNLSTHVATLTPSVALQSLTVYTARVRGGSTGVKDVAGNALGADVTWSFTTRDAVAPVITSVLPAAGATNVASSAMASATFSKAMDATTISATTIELRDAANALVARTVSYDGASQTVVIQPSAALAAGTYTAIVKGTSTGVKDLAGNALAATYSWSFTVGASTPPPTCPCTVFNSSTPATIATDASALELGLRFRPTVNGYITGLRFYKGAGNTGPHTGSLWTNAGTLLATVTFTGETASGWQQMSLPTPVAVTAGTTYLASYHTMTGHYGYDGGYFTGASVGTSPLIALADGADGLNGAYKLGASGFPNQSDPGANYWVDVVFDTSVPADTTAPTVASTSPASGARDVPTQSSVSVTFSESMDPATIASTSVQVRDASNVAVAATVSYNTGTRTATVTPSAALAASSVYSINVTTAVKDVAGNAMTGAFSSSFTTGIAQLAPDQGPGGPILVVTSPANPFSKYYAEILRAEGLNAFQLVDLPSVSAATLAGYDVVVLGEGALTAAQVTMFSDWVNGGGNLIAMRPDKQLAGLLGLTSSASTAKDQYLLMNTAAGPGVGLVNQTIQYHGVADLYTLNGATALATLYSNATTATANPAVTINSVGLNGGQAVAFTYDLARSIVYTRQGNPAWAGQERDGITPVRVDDMFFGAAAADPQPDWVDLSKVAIPQADEQQRLLANIVEQINLRKKPLPRFWYLPRGLKAAVVMTGDDHGGGGTFGRMTNYMNASTPGCSVDDWQCIRSTSYVYPTVPLTDAQASTLSAAGFEIALHGTTQCGNVPSAQFDGSFSDQLSLWANVFQSQLAPATHRMHCTAWNDFTLQPQVEATHGIRLNTTYYYWPGSWVNDRPGMFTGSGFPMRFADTTGTMIDVYQAATQMTDESGQTYPMTINTLLDNALGPNGYYGVFTANMHTDAVASTGSDAIVQAATSRGVPIISARQLLDWVDGRNASSFGSIGWNGNLSFTIAPAAGIHGLQAMVPTKPAVGGLDHITRNGVNVTYTTQTIKGIEYAMFAADAGSYVAVYDTTPPVSSITGQPPTFSSSKTAVLTFTANEQSTFVCRIDGGAFVACTSPATYTNLADGSHTFQVQATDRAGNVEPVPPSVSWTVDTVPPTLTSRSPLAGAANVAQNTTVTVQFSEPMNAGSFTAANFRLRLVGASADVPATIAVAGNTVTLTPSSPLALGGKSYQVTLSGGVTDRAGNTLGADVTWTFTTVSQLRDTTVADFGAGTLGTGAYVSSTADGEVMLTPTSAAEFSGSALAADWTSAAWSAGGSVSVSGGAATANGARLSTTAMFTPGRSLEFVATFSGDGFQHAGFGNTLNETPWAIFSTMSGGGLYARTHNGVTQNNTLIAGSWFTGPHLFRIDWASSSVVFSIDGAVVATHAITIAQNMRPIASDLTVGGGSVKVDWMRMTPYSTTGTFTSRVFDAGGIGNWGQATWTSTVPAGTTLAISVRTGNTPVPDGTWTAFTPLASSGAAVGGSSRYLQYRVDLSTTDTSKTPVLSDITIGGIVP